jgi:hypothetical protein
VGRLSSSLENSGKPIRWSDVVHGLKWLTHLFDPHRYGNMSKSIASSKLRLDCPPTGLLRRMPCSDCFEILTRPSVSSRTLSQLGTRLITVRLLRMVRGRARMDDEDVPIPRITFTHVLDNHGHTLLRRHFPLAPAYATTSNSCQGLTLDRVGVDLTRPATRTAFHRSLPH